MAMAPSASAVSFSARPFATVAGWVRIGDVEGGKWWAPLLGWLGRPDYIEVAALVTATEEVARWSSSFMGGLTEEKARELHGRMVETGSFHDAMYHSTITSHLAHSA